MAEIQARSTQDRVPSLDAWFPQVVPFNQPWPQHHPVGIERLTVGDYAVNNGAFMYRIPLMAFTVEMQGVFNRPLAGSWEALDPQGWDLFDPIDADVLWPAVDPGRGILSVPEGLTEIIPDANADKTSARTYPVAVIEDGTSLSASTWQADVGWAIAAVRLMAAPQPGPLITFTTLAGLVQLGVSGSTFVLSVNGIPVKSAPRPLANDHVYVVGMLLTDDEVRAIVQYGGRSYRMSYPYATEMGAYTLELAFGGDSSPEMMIYALATGTEALEDLSTGTTFNTALTKIAGFLQC